MNEDEVKDEVKLDVQAEQQSFAKAITQTNDPVIKQTTFEQPLHVPPSVTLTAFTQPSPELPRSVSYEPSKLDLSHDTEPQKADVNLNLKIKFDAEESYNHVKRTVEDMQNAIQSMANDRNKRWIPAMRPINSFEEKPSLEQTNLIFEHRKEQFSEYPRWA